MLEVNPVVGHRTAPECGPQTGDRGAVSKSGLVLDESGAEKTRRLLEEIALLVGVLGAAHKSDRGGPVHGALCVPELLSGDPCRVTCFPDLLRDPLHRVFPRDVLPVVAARCPITRLCKPVRRSVSREHGYALHAQGAAIHNVVEVSLHGNQLAFAYRRNHAAAARTKVAGGSELVDVGKLQLLRASLHSRHI